MRSTASQVKPGRVISASRSRRLRYHTCEERGITTSEFCWRGPQVHKTWATRTTYHTRSTGAEASPVERWS